MKTTTFMPSDLLLPHDCDLSQWSVVASDQYINQAEYWQDVENYVGRSPSALRCTLPESCLDGPDMEIDIMSINAAMSEYLRGNVFDSFLHSMMYVERTLKNGKIRKGILGQIDLESYDYTPKSRSLLRGGQWAEMTRIPPRVATRKLAPLEMSHVIILADDVQNRLFDGISSEGLEQKYEVSLMKDGGSVSGWLLSPEQQAQVEKVCENLGNQELFSGKYQASCSPLQFLIGDGNHYLVTAKESYERQKTLVHEDQKGKLPARYVMVELVNLYEEAVDLCPIHRILHHVKPQECLRELQVYLEAMSENQDEAQEIGYHFGELSGVMKVKHPLTPFAVSTLDGFLSQWLETQPKAHLAYTQWAEEAIKESKKQQTLSFILPEMDKSALFSTVIHQGLLPIKSFTLGEPEDKRYYLEARRIRN